MGTAWRSVRTAWRSMGTAWRSVGPAGGPWSQAGVPGPAGGRDAGRMLMGGTGAAAAPGPDTPRCRLICPRQKGGLGAAAANADEGLRAGIPGVTVRRRRSRLLPGSPLALPGWGSSGTAAGTPPCWGHCPCAPQSTHPGAAQGGCGLVSAPPGQLSAAPAARTGLPGTRGSCRMSWGSASWDDMSSSHLLFHPTPSPATSGVPALLIPLHVPPSRCSPELCAGTLQRS